jgi:hypothetical protein
MSADDIVHTGITLPRIADIEPLQDSRLRVTWSHGARAGRTDDVDLSPMINSFKIYRLLRANPDLFKTAKLIENGKIVVWDGDDLEMSAEAVQELAQASMTPEEFVAFLKKCELTQEAFGQIFGYSRRQVGYYCTTGPIPRVVAWACKGYEYEQLLRRIGVGANPQYVIPEPQPLPKPKIKVA